MHMMTFINCWPSVLSCDTSGTTMRVPVKSHLSPACTISTASARRTTSRLQQREGWRNLKKLHRQWGNLYSKVQYVKTTHTHTHTHTHSQIQYIYNHTHLLGMDPLGSSCWVSWTLTFWKSTNLELLTCSMNLLLFWQRGFLQTVGSVNLNCCSTSGMLVWHSRQRKFPLVSSGCTGWVRTTWPLIRSRVPTLEVDNSRTLNKRNLVKLLEISKRNATIDTRKAYISPLLCGC